MTAKYYVDVHVPLSVTLGLRLPGVIYGHQLNITIGMCIKDLELIAKATTSSELKNEVIFLPL